MVTYFKDIYSGLVSLFIGMEVTFKEFFEPTVTVQYPYETLTMTERYRGHVELIENDEGKPNCIVCGLCQRACPSACITLAGVKPEGEKKKVLTKYILDFTRCSLSVARALNPVILTPWSFQKNTTLHLPAEKISSLISFNALRTETNDLFHTYSSFPCSIQRRWFSRGYLSRHDWCYNYWRFHSLQL